MRLYFIFIFLIALSACGNNPQEEMNSAIDVALSHLSSGEGDEALDVLNEVTNDNDNAIYLQVLASAHACEAGFNEISFISTDLEGMDTTDFSSIMTSLAKFTLSDETEVDSTEYTSIKTAINVLLDSTDAAPSQTAA